MLMSLRLSNFVVMDEAEVEFGPGLTVLTGETGAGKSILIDALGLLAGGRADAEAIRAGAEEAVVEGLFECDAPLAARLEALGLPVMGAELCVRRTVGRTGRGRVHVNGALAAVGVLSRLMDGQIDIAGQHEHTALFGEGRQRELVDAFGALEAPGSALHAYREAFAALKDTEAALDALGGDDAMVASRIEFVRFQLEEIERLAPQAGEDVTLEEERKRLGAVERLRALAEEAESLLTAEGAASEGVGRAAQLAQDAQRHDAGAAPIVERLLAAQAEVEESGRLLSRYLASLEADPQRLAEVEDRLDALKRLTRKHAAPLEAVIARQAALAGELDTLIHRGERRAEAQSQRAACLQRAGQAAGALRKARRAAATALASQLAAHLGQLKLPRARFEIAVEEAALSSQGGDEVEFRFSANPGEPVRPLSRVASGGEASRLLLALKATTSAVAGARVSVFDEADAGVGGAVADVVGRLIKALSTHRQVLCITHLPQVAAHADTHLFIDKREGKGRTTSSVQRLDGPEARVREVARMLSGELVTPEATSAAEALLRGAQGPARKKGKARAGAAPGSAERRVG